MNHLHVLCFALALVDRRSNLRNGIDRLLDALVIGVVVGRELEQLLVRRSSSGQQLSIVDRAATLYLE